jgi:hypothetical protein
MAAKAFKTTDINQNVASLLPTSNRLYQQVIK